MSPCIWLTLSTNNTICHCNMSYGPSFYYSHTLVWGLIFFKQFKLIKKTIHLSVNTSLLKYVWDIFILITTSRAIGLKINLSHGLPPPPPCYGLYRHNVYGYKLNSSPFVMGYTAIYAPLTTSANKQLTPTHGLMLHLQKGIVFPLSYSFYKRTSHCFFVIFHFF